MSVRDAVKGYETEYGAVDDALKRLFSWLPRNDTLHEVLLKAASLDRLFSTQLYAIQAMAEHILALDIDAALLDGDLNVVPEIAVLDINGKTRVNTSFASKYCSRHRPEVFPIFDSYVDQSLWDLKNSTGFAQFQRAEMKDYQRFVRILEDFREAFGLHHFALRELDQYLWLIGRNKRWN